MCVVGEGGLLSSHALQSAGVGGCVAAPACGGSTRAARHGRVGAAVPVA